MLEGYEYNDDVVPIIETLTRRDLFRYGSAIAVAKAALFVPGIHSETGPSQVIRIPESPRKVPKFQFDLGTQPELQGAEEARKKMTNRVIDPSFEDKEQVIIDGVVKTNPVGWNRFEDKTSIPAMTRSIYQVNTETGRCSIASICNIFEEEGREYFSRGYWECRRRIKVDRDQDYIFGYWSIVSDKRVSPRLDMPMYDAEGNEITGGWAEFHLDKPHEWQRLYLLTIGPNSLNQWPKGVESIRIGLGATPGSATEVGFTEKASFDRVFFGN